MQVVTNAPLESTQTDLERDFERKSTQRLPEDGSSEPAAADDAPAAADAVPAVAEAAPAAAPAAADGEQAAAGEPDVAALCEVASSSLMKASLDGSLAKTLEEAADQEPAAEAAPAAAEGEQAAAEGEQAAAEAAPAAAEGEEAAAEAAPAAAEAGPAAAEAMPAADGEPDVAALCEVASSNLMKASLDGSLAKTLEEAADQELAAEAAPAAAEGEQAPTEAAPAADGVEPATEDGEPATDGGELATDDGEPATDGDQWATDDGEPATNGIGWATDDNEPAPADVEVAETRGTASLPFSYQEKRPQRLRGTYKKREDKVPLSKVWSPPRVADKQKQKTHKSYKSYKHIDYLNKSNQTNTLSLNKGGGQAGAESRSPVGLEAGRQPEV